MMEELKVQIKYESSQAAKLSKEASIAFENNQRSEGKTLMKEAVAASKKCQELIKQFNELNLTIK
ncbi:hypothetical protein [Chroococcus sp. FPU101]|uniref:hypothetical protein n=1 Tax=Chroococcus sp. FPU101 TaxID=1974212 RepID=UPI001A909BF7|nr:hypothetical protein [Chroococcus sp. FPU101]GFE67940.1 hypothetical protein CFPU101_05500 [Chroococcus sp. FPU101]